MAITVFRTSAFSYQNKGGNEAGVVFDTEALTTEQMLQVAQRVGYSETAFLFPSTVADYKLRYFTPTVEVPLCGHATIAAFNLMRNLGHISPSKITIETDAGILDLCVDEHIVTLTLPNAEFGEIIEPKVVTQALGIDMSQLLSTPLQSVSTGVKELFIGFKTREDLHRLAFSEADIITLCQRLNIEGVYCYTLETIDPNHHAQSRNFLPLFGIYEESATGTAAGAFAAYLNRYVFTTDTAFIIEQGHSMQKPSLLYASVTPDIRVGGAMRFIDKIIGFKIDTEA